MEWDIIILVMDLEIYFLMSFIFSLYKKNGILLINIKSLPLFCSIIKGVHIIGIGAKLIGFF